MMREGMRQIVVMLLLLADLAERAAGAPATVRALTLWWLRQADIVTKEFVTGPVCDTTGRRWSPAVQSVHYGDDPADAMALAASLRRLARAVRCIVLCACCRPDEPLSPSTGRIVRAVGSLPVPGGLVRHTSFAAGPRIDTS